MSGSLPPSGWSADAAAVRRRLRGACLTPGTGEEALATTVVFRNAWETENQHRDGATATDLVVAVQDLMRDFPNVETVVLVVSWFGNDLRASQCLVRPGTDNPAKTTTPRSWTVAGLTRSTAYAISTDGLGNARFGGTPGDVSLVECIRHLKAQGIRVIFYPFMLMDIQAGNSLPNPYSGSAGQPVQPWRGRITTDRHRSISSPTDRTSAARTHVDAFFGAVAASQITCAVNAGTNAVTYSTSGTIDARYRRFILHNAKLCAAINAVDPGAVAGFCVGTEMRELLSLRDGADAYPGVEAMTALLADCKAVLGAGVTCTYAADWSEWNGWAPPEGGWNHHLDPLWVAADAVAIDMYAPIADWRQTAGVMDLSAWYDVSTGTAVIPAPLTSHAAGLAITWEADSDAAALTASNSGGPSASYEGISALITRTPIETGGQPWTLTLTLAVESLGAAVGSVAGVSVGIAVNFADPGEGNAAAGLAVAVLYTVTAVGTVTVTISADEAGLHCPGGTVSDTASTAATIERVVLLASIYFNTQDGAEYRATISDVSLAVDGAGSTNLDAAAAGRSVYNMRYLRSQVAGGELHTYTYADQAARDAQIRTPITDPAHGELWQYRRKDLVGWWGALHFNRDAAGTRAGSSTAWVPQSKPLILSEFGFAKVNVSVNEPNVFVDPNSAEGGYPRYSNEQADPRIQLSGLRAWLEHYREGGPANPVSAIYGGPMLRLGWSCAWSYEARPFPEFPLDPALGSDATRFAKSHSLNGNVRAGALAQLDEQIIIATAGQSNIEKWAYAEVDNSGVAQEPGGRVFRRTLAPLLGLSSAQVTMVYGAVGGSSLLKKMQWSEGGVPKGYWWDESTNGPGPLATALKASLAGRQGTLRALLWDQGESDWIAVTNLGGSRSPTEGMLGRGCSRAEYEAAFAALVAWFRSGAGLGVANLPIIISGIGPNRFPQMIGVNTTPAYHEPVRDYILTGIIEAQYKAARTISGVFDGPSRGQPSGDTGPDWSTKPERRTTSGEDIHLSGPGYGVQATRMAQATAPVLLGTRTWSGALAWQGAAREIVVVGGTNGHFFFGGFPAAGGISGARRMKDVILAAKGWAEGDLSITCHGHDGSATDVAADSSRKYGAFWDRANSGPAVLGEALGDYLARRGSAIKALVMLGQETDFFLFGSTESAGGLETSLRALVTYLRGRSAAGNALPIWWVRAGVNRYPSQYNLDTGTGGTPTNYPLTDLRTVQDNLVANAGGAPGSAGMAFAAYAAADPGGAADLTPGYFGFDYSAGGYRTLGERLASYAVPRI